MRIVLIAHGWLPIPPISWGAIETLIWDSYTILTRLGHQVLIVNTRTKEEIIRVSNEFRPDIVHLHWDEYFDILPKIAGKKVVTSHKTELPLLNNREFHSGDFVLCALNQRIKDQYINAGVSAERIYLMPNGTNKDDFVFKESNSGDKTIYLSDIREAKCQYKYTSIESVYFVGNITCKKFVRNDRYIGVWDRNMVHANLTEFANLLLLSSGECHSLVVCEAVMCGLGVVVSEAASAHLDRTKPWISVIPNDKLDDMEYIESEIIKNRKISVTMRKEIREYAIQNFSIDKNVVKLYTYIAQLGNK